MRRRELRQHQADARPIHHQLFPQRPQVFHLVPVQACSNPAPAGSCCAPGVAEALAQPFRVRRRQRAFQPQPDLLLGVLQIDLDGKFGMRNLGAEIPPRVGRRSSACPAADRSSACSLGCWNRSSFNVTPVHSAAPTASTDLHRSRERGRPSSAWMRRSKSPIQRRTAAFGPSNRPARNTG